MRRRRRQVGAPKPLLAARRGGGNGGERFALMSGAHAGGTGLVAVVREDVHVLPGACDGNDIVQAGKRQAGGVALRPLAALLYH